MDELDDREGGLLTGVVIASGADRGRARIVDTMHVRHESLLRWLAHLPRGALHGPDLRDGRERMQWVARGAGQVCDFPPAVEPAVRTGIDPHVLDRLNLTKAGSRASTAGVRARDASTAYYRAPQEELTVAG